jgi:uncharacterized membrane protein YphA (DoxX/SURF4 family)
MELASLTFRFLLAFVFISASIPKLAARAEFARAMENYGILPRRLVAPVARWLPRLELAVGLALLLGVATGPVALLVAAMLLLFAAGVAWNLVRGRRIDCGCAGIAVPRTISWPLVVRDFALVGVALTLALAPPDTLALVAWWPSHAGGTASSADAVALLLMSALVVVGEALVVDGWRTRAARRRFERGETYA